MTLYLITSNKNKFIEVQAIIPHIKQLDIDMTEIQELDPHKIIAAKLNEASKKHKGEFIVEDTTLYIEALNGFPGPLIKWFLGSIGTEGIADLVIKLGNTKAVAKTMIGYFSADKKIYFFEGSLEGNIFSPRGNTTFGWDTIFQPKGLTKTLAEISKEEKNKISPRRIALDLFI